MYATLTVGTVEGFNQILRGNATDTAKEAGKDWDALIPFVICAYREVPKESTRPNGQVLVLLPTTTSKLTTRWQGYIKSDQICW